MISTRRTKRSARVVKPQGPAISSIESVKLRELAIGASSAGATAIGALALGALAIGAVAIGMLVVRRLKIRQARLASLEIDEFAIRRLAVGELNITRALKLPDEKGTRLIRAGGAA